MASLEDIQFHYDVSNDFFMLFLDETYHAYSCGIWNNALTLEEAQKNKLQRLANFAKIKPGDQVLDIGCGWGGMIDFCQQERQTKKVIGLTLSQAQQNYLEAKQFSTQICSWENFIADTKFDAIVSIGAMEHFASIEDQKQNKQVEVYRNFFKKCFDLSTQDAHLGLQTIVTYNKPNTLKKMKDVYYLLKHVFPGSVLPRIQDLQIAMQGLYEPIQLTTIGNDYVKTLETWKNRLHFNKEWIVANYNETLWQHYNHYFDCARSGFEDGTINLLQMSLRKIN